MMKKWIVLLISLITFEVSGQRMVSKFSITEAIFNKKSITELLVSHGACTIFYTIDSVAYMGNVWVKSGIASLGKISDYVKKEDKTGNGDKKIIYNYKWTYENTYDNKKGFAFVTFTEIFKPKGSLFTMKMICENKDVYFFKGIEVAPQIEY